MKPTTIGNDSTSADVTLGDLRRLYEMSYENYEKFRKSGPPEAACFWDGYCRGIEEVFSIRHE